MAEPSELIVLHENAVHQLAEMYSWYLQQLDGPPTRTPRGDDLEPTFPPSIYLAFIPPSGIPALNQAGTTGTGTPTLSDDVISRAECEIYKVLLVSTTYRLRPAGFKKWVFNPMPIDVPGGLLVGVFKDAYGTWFVNPLPLKTGVCP